MKSGYTSLWILISVSLLIVMAVAFSGDFEIAGWSPKKAPFRDILLADTAARQDLVMPDSVAIPEKEIPVDTTAQSIFIFGDSMTFNLALRLGAYADRNGHTVNAVNWDSSNTKIWAQSDTLSYFIRKFRPTQIFISLGSNELYLKNPLSRKPYIEKILEMIGDIPYVWIGPPNWQEDTGMNAVLANTTRPGSFFLSEGIELARKRDHIHPTRQASALWVDSIMRWIPKSAHPFRAETPSDSAPKPRPNVIFLKALNK